MADNPALRVESSTRGPVSYIRLTGIVDESFDPNVLLREATTSKVILNLKALTRLTSFGVREWTSVMRELGKRAERVFFVECSPAVVNQLNMVDNFAGSAQILSIQVPFSCPQCGFEKELLQDMTNGAPPQLPKATCEQCGAEMQFEDDFESYFAFPNHLEQAAPDGVVQGVLRQFSQGSAQPRASSRADSFAPTKAGTTSGPNRAASLRPMLADQFRSQPPAPSIEIPAHSVSMTPTRLPSPRQKPAMKLALLGAAAIVLGVAMGASVLYLFPGADVVEVDTLMAQDRFHDAAVLLARWEKKGALSADQIEEKRRALTAAVHARHRALLEDEKVEEAEALTSQLEMDASLPEAHRAQLNRAIAAERNRSFYELRRQAQEAGSRKEYDRVRQVLERASRLAPLDRDMTFLLAESLRAAEKRDDASRAYGSFIEMVDRDGDTDPNLDDALYHRARYLAEQGNDQDAKKLLTRCLSMDTEHKEASKQLLALIASKDPGSRAPSTQSP